jgi:hypothetical protein
MIIKNIGNINQRWITFDGYEVDRVLNPTVSKKRQQELESLTLRLSGGGRWSAIPFATVEMIEQV